MSLIDGFVFPLAEELRARGVDCPLCTAFDDSLVIPSELRDMPRLNKPYFDADLKNVLGLLLAEHR